MTTLVLQDLARPCALCGRTPDTGFPFVTTGMDIVWLCQPSGSSTRDCWKEWAIYGARPKVSVGAGRER